MKGPKRKGNNKKKKTTKPSKNESAKTPSIKELIDAGDAAAASMEGDKALAFYESAGDLLRKKKPEPSMDNNGGERELKEQLIYVLEKLGEGKVSMGDVEAARRDFESAIELLLQTKPEEKNAQYYETLAGLYLYIGQVSSELEALEVQKKGLHSLELCAEIRQKECLALGEPPQQSPESEKNMDIDNHKEAQAALYQTRQKLGQAYATVAELYLTDLCFEDNAETECQSYVDSALKFLESDGEPVVDALQTAASLRLSQSRKEEAMQFISRVYAKMKKGCEALAKLVGLEENSRRAVELVEVDAADSLPSFEFRLQTAKLLLECAAEDTEENNNDKKPSPNSEKLHQKRLQCNRAAIQVLASLMAENDEVPECWYLLGCAFQATDNNELSSHYWTRALEMLSNIHKELEKEMEETNDMQDDDDEHDEIESQMQSISCQMEDIRSKLEEIEDDEAMEE